LKSNHNNSVQKAIQILAVVNLVKEKSESKSQPVLSRAVK